MKTLEHLAREVTRGQVIKLHFADGHSYTGQVKVLKKTYVGVAPLGSPRTETITLPEGIFKGRIVTGYETFDEKRNESLKGAYCPLRTPHEY